MPSSTFSYTSSDGTQITACRWDPAGEPRAVIQLTHGMGEHARRYDYVARALNDAGFAVYAQDQRGHGASTDPAASVTWAPAPGPRGRSSAPSELPTPGVTCEAIYARKTDPIGVAFAEMSDMITIIELENQKGPPAAPEKTRADNHSDGGEHPPMSDTPAFAQYP